MNQSEGQSGQPGTGQPSGRPLQVDPTWLTETPTTSISRLADQLDRGAPALVTPPTIHPLLAIARTLGVFLAAGTLVYFILTGPTYWQRIVYAAQHWGKPNVAEEYVDVDAPADSLSGAIGVALRQPTFARPTDPVASADRVTTPLVSESLELADNVLVIPKIRVRTPVIWNSSSNEEVMLANLRQGVAHYGFTSLPNAERGNVFITGHSSYYWWDSGKYRTVFALLDKLTEGDQAFIQYQGEVYVYSLESERVVSPTEVSVTDPSDEPVLSLMTCVPVGTSLSRLVSRFRLVRVYPAEGTTQSAEVPPAITPSPVEVTPANRESIKMLPGLR